MLRKIPSTSQYVLDHGGIIDRFHFSFGDYHDPDNDHFGVIQALNEFSVQAGKGFASHIHEESEIISYCIQGELTHRDGMGNKNTIKPGELQYMCAGTGVTHEEMNTTTDGPLRFIQILITPKSSGMSPHYSSMEFSEGEKRNKLLRVVSGKPESGLIHINQDTDIFVSEIDAQEQLVFNQGVENQSYLVCIDGTLMINGIHLRRSDALVISGEFQLNIKALEDAHFLMVEMNGYKGN
jgi:redox-sensitive bicupin YhaK (pirin superfamily)